MDWTITRTLRTPSSERLIVRSPAGMDVAAADLHFLQNAAVCGTLILLDGADESPKAIEALLAAIDEQMLPMASLNDKNLEFTVVSGRVLGNFAHEVTSN